MNNDRAVEAVEVTRADRDLVSKLSRLIVEMARRDKFDYAEADALVARHRIASAAAAQQAFQSGETLAPDNGDKDRGSLVEAPTLVGAVQVVARAHVMPGDPPDITQIALQWYLGFDFGHPHTARESNIAVEGFKDGYRAALAAARPLLFAEAAGIARKELAMVAALNAENASLQWVEGVAFAAGMAEEAIRTAGSKSDD